MGILRHLPWRLRVVQTLVLFAVAMCHQAGTTFAAGTFVSAPNRVDMVHDPARDILYITSGSNVLRYHLGSDAFLAPFQLSGSLRGIDLSPDGNKLIVADGSRSETNVWVHVIDLPSGASTRAFFPRAFYEGGTYAVAFGADGAALITSNFEGSGWVPLRRFDPATGAAREISSTTSRIVFSFYLTQSFRNIGYEVKDESGAVRSRQILPAPPKEDSGESHLSLSTADLKPAEYEIRFWGVGDSGESPIGQSKFKIENAGSSLPLRPTN